MDQDKLQKDILALYSSLREKMRREWDRDLPFDELLFNRWERARDQHFSEGANIYHMSYIYGDVKVGKDTWVGPFTILDGTGGLTIGEHCCISTGVHIYTHDTAKRFVSGGKAPNEYKPVTIGDCCFIGPQSVVRCGVSVCDHTVVGAFSFVTNDLPPFSIAAGIPAKILGKVIIDKDMNVSFEYFPKSKVP